MIECYTVFSLTPRLGFHPCSALDCWFHLTVRQNFNFEAKVWDIRLRDIWVLCQSTDIIGQTKLLVIANCIFHEGVEFLAFFVHLAMRSSKKGSLLLQATWSRVSNLLVESAKFITPHASVSNCSVSKLCCLFCFVLFFIYILNNYA